MANQRAVSGAGRGRGRRRRERNAADADASVSSAFLNWHATNRTRIVPGVIGFMRLVTNSVTLDRLPSFPHSPIPFPCHILAVIDANQTWAHHRHYHRHQRQMRFKFDYSQLFRNMHFIFIFNFVFIPISFFSIFCTRNAPFLFLSEFLIPCHASSPLALWLFLFGFGFGLISILSCSACIFCFFFFIFYWFTRVDSVLRLSRSLSPRDGCICLIEIDFSFLAGDLRLDLRTIITITILYGIALYCAVF